MQREILRREWKRFLIQLQKEIIIRRARKRFLIELQKSSDAVIDSPAGMFFSRPHDLRWQPAYIHKRVARGDSRVSGVPRSG